MSNTRDCSRVPDCVDPMSWLEKVRVYQRARSFVRARFFAVLRRAFITDDGRSILRDALANVYEQGISLPPYGRPPKDYPELRGLCEDSSSHKRFVIVTGRFRTGSTLLWNLFRHLDACTAYYEPFNERRYFDRKRRGTRTDPTHVNVEEQWKEYDGLPCCEELAALYSEEWTRRGLYMSADSWAPSMLRFIERIVEGTEGLAILQFNRVDFRLPWLRANFPHAAIIHVYRHPRDQWCSTLQDITRYAKTRSTRDFAAHDGFYLRTWARDLRYHFPFLDENQTSHAYELFYYIWRLSYLFGIHHADYSVAFERIVASPGQEVERLLKFVGIVGYDVDRLTRLVVTPKLGRWGDYANEEWFQGIEARCEEVLSRFFNRCGRATSEVVDGIVPERRGPCLFGGPQL